jgi:DNA helicase HerA-like ATPase
LRVPVFVVVEEAHNIVPAKPTSFAAEALKNQLRTIAAEGRKYGVFLILVTQPPDKIDPLIVSECENRAVMRLGARAVLTKAESLLGQRRRRHGGRDSRPKSVMRANGHRW